MSMLSHLSFYANLFLISLNVGAIYKQGFSWFPMLIILLCTMSVVINRVIYAKQK